MIKYTVYKMGRIVVNKHFDDKSLITSEKFVNKGEIIISNQPGYEGLFITSKSGELFFIGPTEGTGSDVPVDYKEYVNGVVDELVDVKLATQGALVQILSAATVDELANIAVFSAYTVSKINEINEVINGFSASTIDEISRLDESINDLREDFKDIAAGVIDEEYIKTIIDNTIEESLKNLEGDITETVNQLSDDIVKIDKDILAVSGSVNNINTNIIADISIVSGAVDDLRADLMDLSAYTQSIVIGGGGPVEGGLSREEVEEICSIEIAKIVDGADAKYDTLKEIADWISNDSTGAASMANDIENLKSQLNALILGAKASISSNKSIIYSGVDTEVTITGKLTPDSLTPCEIYLYKGALYGEVVATGITPTVTFTDTISTNTTYAIKAVYNGTPYTATTRVNAYHPSYCGFGAYYTNVIDNGTKELKSSAKGSYKGASTEDGVHYFILVPSGVGEPSTFTMGGAPFNMNKTEEIINGVVYKVFKSGSVFNNGGSVDITAS